MDRPLHDLFLLTTSLSQLKNKEEVIGLFTEGINTIFPTWKISWHTESEALSSPSFQVCTRTDTYGFICFDKSIEQDLESFSLLQNATQMLAILLEKLVLESLLNDQKNHLKILVDEKTSEFATLNEEFEMVNEELTEGNAYLREINEQLAAEIKVRQQTEIALQKNRTLLCETESMAKIGGWEFDVKTFHQTWTEETFHILEIDTSHGAPAVPQGLQFFAPGSRPKAELAIQRAIQFNEPYDEEWEIITTKGSHRWVRAMAKINQENGVTVSVSGTFHDITERKQMEEDLRQSEERYKSFFERNESVMLLIHPENGDIVDANPSACKFYGMDYTEICRTSIFSINILPREEVIKEMQRVRNEKHKQFHFKHHVANGEIRDVEVYSTPITFSGTTLLYSIIHDITDRKIIENKLINLNETLEVHVAERTRELETINKELSFHLREIEQFTFIASHDLQEPLLTISNFTQILKDEYAGKLDEVGNKSIEFISKSADRMSNLVKGLLLYSLLGEENLITPVDCNMAVNDVLADLDSSIRKSNATITISELPTVNGFDSELRILFQNLLMNAIKFHRKDVFPEVKISAERNSDEWTFSVEDNGIGIEEKDKEKVFIIFKRLHNRDEYGGTGIGLAHCKKIVELHGGKIWVESEKDKGAIFNFTIPVNRQ